MSNTDDLGWQLRSDANPTCWYLMSCCFKAAVNVVVVLANFCAKFYGDPSMSRNTQSFHLQPLHGGVRKEEKSDDHQSN